MNDKMKARPGWYAGLTETPFESPAWTEEKKEALRTALRSGPESGFARPRLKKRAAVAAAALLLVLVAAASLGIPSSGAPGIAGPAGDESWLPRSQYEVGGVVQWEVFPGGDLVAGKPAGAGWMIRKPLAELMGHKARIVATHRQTGLTLVELPETTIDETTAVEFDRHLSSAFGAVDQTRLATDLALPLGGEWKFQLSLDGEPQGDVVLNVPEAADSWKPSGSFVSGPFEMTGVKDKLAFIHPGFVAGKGNKYMWHFWGTDEEIGGDFQVFGVKRGSGELVKVFEGQVRPSPHNGADAAIPSSMMLPSAGAWKLVVTINERWFGTVVVEVREPTEQEAAEAARQNQSNE
ncbi:hypothetical protein J19TS2_21950 [Cohnella xylanilytica]|uniref:DUF4871 domain-containing protein n=1 Tax=Cohnella xylanilytica TaxID=557555 RepID=A0A841U4C7_9BACL|nr:DUF4871 domain-containing protein [Cohnella xylanilytica]MBB6695567.1 DUF4871 domain-containing protein [Cohnella xylanilytica]GIO12640.1 hypothetical protein J19TS2_21950 [Cohnella xylanilytica]